MLTTDSLIQKTARAAMEADQELALWFGAELPKIDRSTPIGDYTGERFHAREPHKYQLCAQMCADPGISTRAICKVLHITDDTVRGVRARESEIIKGHAQALSRKLEHLEHVATERAIEALPTANAVQAATVMAIAVDKRAVLNGNATAILEIKHTGGDNFARYHELLEKVKALAGAQREKLVHATVIENTTLEASA